MLPQACIFRQAEHVTQPEAVAQVQNLRGAVVAVGPQQDRGRGPMAADRPDQTPDVGSGLFAGRATCRAQHCTYKTTVTVKDHDGLEAVFIIVGIEQAQLLVTMNGIKGVVDIQHDLSGRVCKRGAIEPHHLMRHPEERPPVSQVFHTRDRGLRAQRGPGLGIPLESELERRIIAQISGIVAVFISSRDHHDPEPDDVFQAVPHLARLARIREALCDQTRQIGPAFDLPQERQTGIGAHLRAVKIEQDGFAVQG